MLTIEIFTVNKLGSKLLKKTNWETAANYSIFSIQDSNKQINIRNQRIYVIKLFRNENPTIVSTCFQNKLIRQFNIEAITKSKLVYTSREKEY